MDKRGKGSEIQISSRTFDMRHVAGNDLVFRHRKNLHLLDLSDER